VSPTASPESASEQRELKQHVAAALADLPEPQRLALILRHYEGMSFEEIARLTGTPASTLKSRFAAALNFLRVRLRHLDPTEEHRP
jgi:RNA polymerase sigma-70 factor (ECF subfamily)